MGGYVAFSLIYACLALIKQPLQGDFHVPLNSLSSAKTAKSSLARGHIGGGGGDRGYLELGSGTPAMG